MNRKTTALESLIKRTSAAFIALQETGSEIFAQSTSAGVVTCHGYVPFVDQRKNQSSHGGCALLVRIGIAAQRYTWQAAENWSDCEHAAVEVALPEGRGTLVVCSLYVSGGSDDIEGFTKLINAMPDNMIVLGDLNAQMPDHDGSVSDITRQRGIALQTAVEHKFMMIPTASAPTRPSRQQNGPVVEVDYMSGSIIDHIVVGNAAIDMLISCDNTAVVICDPTPSDHLPLVWTAALGLPFEKRSVQGQRRINWARITGADIEKYNIALRQLLSNPKGARMRNKPENFSHINFIEKALTTAAWNAFPTTRPREVRRELYREQATEARVAETINKHGVGAQARITHAHDAARRAILAEKCSVEPNPSSAWSFIANYYGFRRDATLRPPLKSADPNVVARTPQQRANVLAQHYAAVQACDTAQAKLDAAISRLPPVGSVPWHEVSVTELRACIAEFQSNKAADFMGIKGEHFKLLDDESLRLLLPRINRHLEQGIVPAHWRLSPTTPVPKPKRDHTSVRGFRPVTVTAVFSRVLEKITHNRVQHRLEQGGRRGQSQFGFRRGISTALPLSGACMFIEDGHQQSKTFTEWDASDLEQRNARVHGEEQSGTELRRNHATLIVCIDAQDAFLRTKGDRVIDRLHELGLVHEARWIAQLLKDRKLFVREQGAVSDKFDLDTGASQGCVTSPLLWSLLIDDLIVACEDHCKNHCVPGCVAVPIFFADDKNFIIRGFNPSSCITMANQLLGIVKRWCRDEPLPHVEPSAAPERSSVSAASSTTSVESANAVEPWLVMGKLQASFITGGNTSEWAKNWTAGQGEIVYDENLRCVPSTEPVKLLGVTFDTAFRQNTHAQQLLETGERHLRLLAGMRSVAKAEKLALIYRGIILSRLLYAVDTWWPYTTKEMRDKIESLHYRACCIITGCNHNLSPHRLSVIYEAGFREFDVLVRDEMIKIGDKLRRIDDGEPSRSVPCAPVGPAWVARLFRDGLMPTAELRQTNCSTGVAQFAEYNLFHIKQRENPQQGAVLKLRDVAKYLPHATDNPGSRDVRAWHPQSLRPLARPHPYPPHELAIFDTHVKFITKPPRGLIKPAEMEVREWPRDLEEQFAAANEERIQMLCDENPGAIFGYTDGSRHEGKTPGCAGFYSICSSAQPQPKRNKPGYNILSEGAVAAGKLACVYSGESGTILGCLQNIQTNAAKYFKGKYTRRVVLVTDSRSSLETLRTTWLARIELREQEITRTLFELAKMDIFVTLAFVFSHVGGAPGNDYVDEKAEKACNRYGQMQDAGGAWRVDTTRRALGTMRNEADIAAASSSKWRFTAMPQDLKSAPSQRMPRALSRQDEMLLFQARVGLLNAAGGMLHGQPGNCPLCLSRGAMQRGGAALEHLQKDCVIASSDRNLRPLDFCLWQHPVEAAARLRHLVEEIRKTELGQEIRNRQQQRH